MYTLSQTAQPALPLQPQAAVPPESPPLFAPLMPPALEPPAVDWPPDAELAPELPAEEAPPAPELAPTLPPAPSCPALDALEPPAAVEPPRLPEPATALAPAAALPVPPAPGVPLELEPARPFAALAPLPSLEPVLDELQPARTRVAPNDASKDIRRIIDGFLNWGRARRARDLEMAAARGNHCSACRRVAFFVSAVPGTLVYCPRKMSAHSIQDAQDLSAFAVQARERLTLARAKFDATHDADPEERRWLEVAAQRVTDALERTQVALLDAAPLPELASARKVKRETLSNAWADAVESVFDAIVANVSANGPLVEALFPHQRFAALRRPGTSAQNFWLEFERRAESGYVRRLCQDPAYEFLPPLLEAARESERQLREQLTPRALPEAKAALLRDAVNAAAESLELALRQARSLVEAAFAATPSVVSELGFDAKLKRRATRSEPAKLSVS
jgi:hypothetical protein